MADAKMLNMAKAWQRFAAIPDALAVDIGDQLDKEAVDLVAAIQRAAPVSPDFEKTPGELRDSVHRYANHRRPLSYYVIADAKDEHGEFIGPHVEWGHLARNGKHVAAVPFFFPTYRARRTAMKRRLSARVRKTLKRLFPEQ